MAFWALLGWVNDTPRSAEPQRPKTGNGVLEMEGACSRTCDDGSHGVALVIAPFGLSLAFYDAMWKPSACMHAPNYTWLRTVAA